MHDAQREMHDAQPASSGSGAPAKPRGHAIVITSGKGGVGKTTTTANVGAALAARGGKVALVDADVGLRNLDIVLGLESRVRYHLLDVIEGKVTLEEALIRDKRSPNMSLLAASQTREKDDVEITKMRELIEQLRESFDWVLIDCPAGIEAGFRNAIVGAQSAIVVCTPEVSSVRDADRVVGLLPPSLEPKLIVNRIRPHLVRRGKMLSVEDVNAILRLPLLGIVADEPEVVMATNRGEPIALDPRSATGASYRSIAARIVGENVPVERPKLSFFARISALFGGR
jgi:septum site-determining protein MinD